MDLQAVILCGGLGTRMGPVTDTVPKPMVRVGGQPLLWHILQGYAAQGCRRFVLCIGYRGDVIRRWVEEGLAGEPDWSVTLAETGAETPTGGRLLAARPHLDAGRPVFMTYGDGVADVDLAALLARHRHLGALATVTAMRPRSRFGTLELDGAGRVSRFEEKPLLQQRVSGGFFVLEPGALDNIRPGEAFEQGPLSRLAEQGRLGAHVHDGFWMSVDTPRDLAALQQLWKEGTRPWLNASS